MSETDGSAAMTTTTPEQMRALAGEWQQQLHDAAMTQSEKNKRERTVTALLAAADEVETAQAQLDQWADQVAAVERVADMAQDDEDGNGWVPVGPLLDALYPEKRGVSND